MRDYRDAKAMAQTIRAALAAKGLKISISESLELIAKAFGAGDWNTLAAAIKVQPGPAADPPAAAPQPEPAPAVASTPTEPPSARTPNRFSANLEATLYRAVALAQARQHQYTTLEHLLLALLDDADAAAVMEACQVDRSAMRADVTRYVDEDLKALVVTEPEQPVPTAGFHRVIQRAVIHMQSAGRYPVTGANVLVTIFSEQESHAARLLAEQRMTRWDAVNFIANGIRKDGAAA